METLNTLRGVKVIAGDDAALRVVDGKDVQILFISLPAGPLDLTQYHPLTESGIVELANCLVVESPRGKIRVIKSEERFDTAANPDFQVSAATRQEMAMRKMVQSVLDANRERFQPARENSAKASRTDETQVIEENADGSPTQVVEKQTDAKTADTKTDGSGKPQKTAGA